MRNCQKLLNILGANVRRLREEKGISQAEFAKELDCHVQTVLNIERAKRFTSGYMLEGIAKIFDVKLMELFRE